MKLLIRFIALCFLTSSLDAKKEVWITASNIPNETMSQLQILVDGEIVQHQFSMRQAGKPVSIPDTGVFQIIRKKLNDAQEEHDIITNVTVDKDISKALVVITPGHAKSGSSNFKSHVENLGDFGMGDKLFINISDYDMKIQLGDEVILLPKSKSEKYKAAKIGESRTVKLLYQFQKTGEELWQTIGESSYYLQPNTREIVLFYQDIDTDEYNYHGITINL